MNEELLGSLNLFPDKSVKEVLEEIFQHVSESEERYGNYASSHEALGVIFEEFDELTEAIRANRMESVREEAIDLTAVLIRLAVHCRGHKQFWERSTK